MPQNAPQPLCVERIRDVCIQAAIEAYEDAGMRGLCLEGRWEVALDAMKHVNLKPVTPKTPDRQP